MRNNIKPIWEDISNKDGGSYSYKILNKNIKEFWTKLSYYLIGETIINNLNYDISITGLTISPKKNFCIIKIWVNNCKYQNIDILNSDLGFNESNCIFKKHIQ